MQLIFEFLSQQWMLAGAWLMLALMLFYHESRKAGPTVSNQELSDMVNREDGVVLDVRDGGEFKNGHITSSVNIPLKDLEKRSVELNRYKDKPVIVVCKFGQTATGATKTLRAEGFEKVFKLRGGITEWSAANLPLVK
ncbi:putative protein YibN [BD1-7 clade bacterium]|uniref:Rhodanese domain-containing protein n=1 Tax=BD1-7 clade bacterium TaxID=2029982 RepID=A0A5S9MQM1_9GAMM|nr:putative protein YibN [BD1-7 clade bacterium]CAA0085456.1 putative protein YibN [BD1-7 clade bacterium]